MSIREREKVGIDSMDRWMSANLGLLVNLLDDERQTRVMKYLADCSEAPEYFSFGRRWLSEMPLCRSLKKVTSINDYTYHGEGHVLVTWGLDEPTKVSHGFLYRKSDKSAICFTPGQFIYPDNRILRPGERIGKLKTLAPDLVDVYPGGIAILHGRLSEIGSQTGLVFTYG